MHTNEYERYVFRLITQEENESIDSFVERLKFQAQRCEFNDLESQMKDQIIEKCLHNEVRSNAFKHAMTLDQLIYTAKTFEAVGEKCRTEMSPIPFNRPVMRMNNQASDNCTRCGSSNHSFNSKRCPAWKALCGNCTKVGHYTNFCRFLQRKRPQSGGPRMEDRKRFAPAQSSAITTASKIIEKEPNAKVTRTGSLELQTPKKEPSTESERIRTIITTKDNIFQVSPKLV